MADIAARLAQIRSRIDRAAEAAGRDPGEVRLLPVSKTQRPEVLREAYAAGVRLFGENRVQELADKAEQLADLPELGFAVIGHLQTNKAREVAALAAEFHALDSVRLAEVLDRRLTDLDRTLDVFVQVNSSAEPQKFGFDPAEVPDVVADLDRFERLRFRGLMTLAVFSDDTDAVAACFRRMQDLRDELLRGRDGQPVELSMGMSGDFELAIAHGATTVRVGEAIFGSRLDPRAYWS